MTQRIGVAEHRETEHTETEPITAVLRKLAQLVAAHGLSELTVEDGGMTLSVKAAAAAVPPPYAAVAVPAHPHLLAPEQFPVYSETAVLTAPTQARSTAIALESPMVGVFYQSPSPDDPPFVSVGDLVKIGQTIGLIEAMKVYSEVPSEAAGRVLEMPVESGKLVQQGQPLILIEPLQ